MTTVQNFRIQMTGRTPGKHFSRSARSQGQIPAVVYGPKTKPLNVQLRLNDAIRYSKHGFENTIFTIESEDKALNGMRIMRKDLDIHPVSRMPIHMDFFAPDMTKSVRVEVEVRFTGKAIGTTEGGIVNIARREIEVECLPSEIPESFDLDITNLGLNESLHVSDLVIGDKFKLITSPTETLVTCSVVEEVKETPVAAAAEAAPAAGAAPAAAPAAGETKK